MAKRLTIREIQEFDSSNLGKLNDKELRKLVADSARIANQRIRRLEQSGLAEISRAYNSNVREGHKRFGVGTKQKRASLRNEFKAIREFLDMKTSTVSGTKEVRKKVNERFGFEFKTPKAEKRFWSTYRLAEEKGDIASLKNGSPTIIERLYRVKNDKEDFKKLLRGINAMNSDISDEEIEELVKNNTFIDREGNKIKVKRTKEDLATLMAEETERLYREGWGQTHDDREYNSLSPRKNR